MKRQLLDMRSVQRAKWKTLKSAGKKVTRLDATRLSGSHGNLLCGYIITACECSPPVVGWGTTPARQRSVFATQFESSNHHRAEQSAANPRCV